MKEDIWTALFILLVHLLILMLLLLSFAYIFGTVLVLLFIKGKFVDLSFIVRMRRSIAHLAFIRFFVTGNTNKRAAAFGDHRNSGVHQSNPNRNKQD